MLIACDMPFLNRALLKYMLTEGIEDEVVVPKWRERFEPMHAIYASRCLTKVQESIASGNVRMTDFFPTVQVHEISQDEIQLFDPEGLCFFNINTPADLSQAERIFTKQG
jgi:molybdopterin-guanine dinucleotide biosynthesis protein A